MKADQTMSISNDGNTMLGAVAYDKCQLVAKKEQVYTADGKYMFSVSITDRAKALLDNDGWEKEKESWLDYRQRTESERELEKQKQYKLAADLADAFNRMHGNDAKLPVIRALKCQHDWHTFFNKGYRKCNKCGEEYTIKAV